MVVLNRSAVELCPCFQPPSAAGVLGVFGDCVVGFDLLASVVAFGMPFSVGSNACVGTRDRHGLLAVRVRHVGNDWLLDFCSTLAGGHGVPPAAMVRWQCDCDSHRGLAVSQVENAIMSDLCRNVRIYGCSGS